jgi:hypothetical protein
MRTKFQAKRAAEQHVWLFAASSMSMFIWFAETADHLL